MEKVLKVCSLPAGRKHAPGINLKGDYLAKFGFNIDDFVKVTVKNGIITIEKTAKTELLTQMTIKNPKLLKLLETFDLEPCGEV